MRKQAFGPYQVSVIGLGSTDFGGRCPEQEAWAFMDAYMELGGNFLDTAHVYGDFVTPKNGESERVIGRWMAQRHNREKIFLSTKGAHPPIRDMAKSRLDRASICQDMAESLEALGTDHVDIYWLHRDDICRPVGEIVETLQELVENGYTRMTGVSNWTSARILEADAYAREHGLNRIIANPAVLPGQAGGVRGPHAVPDGRRDLSDAPGNGHGLLLLYRAGSRLFHQAG